MCQRQSLSVFEGQSTFLQKGQWEFTATGLNWYSHKHYVGTHPNPSINPYGPFNKRTQFDFRLFYGLTNRWELSLDVPVQFQSYDGFWPVYGYSTTRVPVKTGADGFGDIVVSASRWMFSTEQSKGNVSLSFGLSIPTGNTDATSEVYGRTIPVEWNVQPGGGSWGLVPTIRAFRNLRWGMTAYGAATYLITPRDTTGTPVFSPDLFYGQTSVVNSSADQYFAESGLSFPSPLRWISPTVAYVVSGVPRRDLIGGSDGFRRPATLEYVAPGFNLAIAGQVLTLGVPLLTYYNIKPPIQPNIFGNRVLDVTDATIPGVMVSATYSFRFGSPWRAH